MGTSDPVVTQVRTIREQTNELAYDLIPDPNLEGAPLYVYGHSWTEYPNRYSTPETGEYQTRTAKRLRLGKVTTQGIPGIKLPELLACAIAPEVNGKDRRFTIGAKGIVLLHALVNDIAKSDSTADDSLYEETYRHSLRSFLAWVSAGTFIPAANGTLSGTWGDSSAGTAALYPGGALKQTSTTGSAIDYQVTGDEAWIWTVGTDPGLATGGAWEVSVNGVTLRSFTSQGAVKQYHMGNGTLKRDMVVAVKVAGMNAAAGTTGAKALRFKATSAPAGNVFCAGVSLPSTTPPAVFVAKEAPYNPTGNATARGKFDARSPIYHKIIEDVAAEFPNAHTVDMAQGWDHASMYSAKDPAHAHPNDLGMARLATTLAQRIRETITSPDPGVLVL